MKSSYNPETVPIGRHRQETEIIKYLSLKGFKCIAVEKSPDLKTTTDFKEGEYYVVKNDNIGYPEGQGFLPPLEEALIQGMLYEKKN